MKRGAGRRFARRFALGALLLASTLSARDASAYCRTSTGGLAVMPDGRECRPSGTNCCTIGKPIYWKNACIGFSMHQLPTTKHNISFPMASRTLAQAFGIWTSASCPGGQGDSRVSIDVRQLPTVECTEAKTKLDTPNQNLIIFRDKVWGHADPDRVLALTIVSFNRDSGEIRGADLEFNTANIPSLACPTTGELDQSEASCFDAPPPENAFDFASIVTHEVGHFLGLAHSNDERATMAAQYSNQDYNNYTLRTLTADDIAGICSAYPPDGTRRVGEEGKDAVPQGPCDPTPYNGFSSKCVSPGCAVTGAGRKLEGGALAAAAALALALRRARRDRDKNAR